MALKTETNTPAMEERIQEAFLAAFNRSSGATITSEDVQLDFEHGQWWATVLGSGAAYSVVDAEGGDSIDGFSFEQVARGDDA